MQVQPYLFFEGRCDEALDYYKRTLGAQVTALMRYSDSPDPIPPGAIPPGAESKVLHANFSVGGTQLMASDGNCSGTPNFAGFALSLEAADAADAERKCNALADGGKVTMPFGETFFAKRFGMVIDRFGVTWMVLAEPRAGVP
jgi:PhnB protein